jgi:radical SAM superfamily enzyme YgiQ (UPF0313 family)
MKKILLTHSYFLQLDPKQLTIGLPYAPLATLYAASVLRNHQYDIHFFDTMFCRKPDMIEAELIKYNPDIFIIYDDGFNYLTKMCLSNMREAAFEMIELAKQKGSTVIISSSDSTDHYDVYLNKGVDFVLMGEGEISLLELMEAITNEKDDFSHVQGIVFKQKNTLIKTARRDLIQVLDELPFPAWDMIDMNPYRQSWMKNAGYFSINMATTRGCPFKCNWCAKPIYGNRYHSRSPENVVQEIKMLKEKFNFNHIWFCDDIFGLKPYWVNSFANLIQRESLVFTFKIQSRADLLVQENYVQALFLAGCNNVWMGAESGSQKILNAMDKGITVEQISEAVRLLKKNDIKASFFIQFGYLDETKEDIQLTVKMINTLLPHEIGISVSYPLPGTIFFEKVKQQLQTKTNWTDSDEMALLFRNTYQPAFYKQLHIYVHKSYRKHLAMAHFKNLITHPFRQNYCTVKKALSLVYYIPIAFIEKVKLKQLENLTV